MDMSEFMLMGQRTVCFWMLVNQCIFISTLNLSTVERDQIFLICKPFDSEKNWEKIAILKDLIPLRSSPIFSKHVSRLIYMLKKAD